MKHILNPLIASLGSHADLRKTPRLFDKIQTGTPDVKGSYSDAMSAFAALGTFEQRNRALLFPKEHVFAVGDLVECLEVKDNRVWETHSCASQVGKSDTVKYFEERFGENCANFGFAQLTHVWPVRAAQALKFIQDTNAVTVANETMVMNKSLWYAGRIDCILKINGRFWLIDWKINTCYAGVGPQLAAYRQAWNTKRNQIVEKVAVVVLKENSYELIGTDSPKWPGNPATDWQTFKEALKRANNLDDESTGIPY